MDVAASSEGYLGRENTEKFANGFICFSWMAKLLLCIHGVMITTADAFYLDVVGGL